MPITSLRIDTSTRDRLDALKVHPRESYNEVINRLITMAVDEKPLSAEAVKGLEEALEDIRAGRVHPEGEIMKDFGL
jgi:predicted transcriptional regulator